MNRELPALAHLQSAQERRHGVSEAPAHQVRTADGGIRAGEGERTIDTPGEVQRAAGRRDRVVEAPEVDQGRGDVVHAELGESELRRPPRRAVARRGPFGLHRRPAALEEAHGFAVSAQTPMDLAEPEVRLDYEAAARHGLRQL